LGCLEADNFRGIPDHRWAPLLPTRPQNINANGIVKIVPEVLSDPFGAGCAQV
jgi:hypothetical protein